MRTFQNAMYTIQLNPQDRILKPELTSNYRYVQKLQNLIISSN